MAAGAGLALTTDQNGKVNTIVRPQNDTTFRLADMAARPVVGSALVKVKVVGPTRPVTVREPTV